MKKLLNLLLKVEKGVKPRLALLSLGLATSFILAVPHNAVAESNTDQKPTRIEVDEKNDVISFYIKGEASAMLDENGLHVIKQVNYGETIKDAGAEHITTYIENTEKQ